MKPRMAPRSAVQVVVAFIAAPLIAGCVIWLGFLADDARYRPVDWGSELQFLWVLLLIAESLGLAVELVVMTPAAVLIQRSGRGWPGLPAWIAGGLIAGEIVYAIVSRLIGPHYWIGWPPILRGALLAAVAGIVTATAFCVMALRRDRPVGPTDRHSGQRPPQSAG